MKTFHVVLIGAGAALALALLFDHPTKAGVPSLSPPPPPPTPLPPTPPAPPPAAASVTPIPARPGVFVSRDANPPPNATVGPPNVTATFKALQVSTAVTTTIAVGDVRQGTPIADVTLIASAPNPNGGDPLHASLTDTFTVVWVSPDAQRIAFVYDAAVGMRNGMNLGPSGLLIAHR